MDAKRVFLAEHRCANDPTVRNTDRNQPTSDDQRSIGPSMNSTSLKQITPVVLTFDEEVNLRRTLDSLHWAERIVLLDSGSTDQTEAIARSYSSVDWHIRPFDNFRSQWEHTIHQTDIATEYVLALDADMEVSARLLEEIVGGFLKGDYHGGVDPLGFCFYGPFVGGSDFSAP